MADKERIGALDGLRGIFAIVVMIGHFSLFSTHFQTPAFKNVALSVQFFFILSGFALCHGFEEKMRNGVVSLGNFVRQRLARLYPLHILSMAAAGMFIWPLMGTLNNSDNFAWVTFLNLVLLQCVGLAKSWSWNLASWSISTEFWVGIVVMPIAFRYISSRAAATLSLVGYVVLYATHHTVRNQFAMVVPGVESGVLSTASGLLMGIAICRTVRDRLRLRLALKRHSLVIGFAEMLMLAAIIYINYLAKHGDVEFLAIALMPILIFSAAASNSWMSALLASRPLVWLGQISYSIYLLHVPILGALTDIGITEIDNLYVRFAVFAVIVLSVSAACYRWFEHPIYQRFRYSIGRSTRKADAAT